LRDRISVPASIGEDEAKQLAQKSEKVQPFVQGKQVVNVIYVPGKLVNIVVR
jgi:leucyl-tRNA synthetase